MSAAITSNEVGRREALNRVLTSRTFARAGQLKSLLAYLGEKELSGLGAALTEYQIGVEALGRRKDFSPAEDAAVRNRIYLLRRKLESYYADENPADPVRIELDKGSYRPVFRVAGNHPSPQTQPVLLDTVIPALPTKPPRQTWTVWISFAMGIAVASAAFLLVRPMNNPLVLPPPPAVREAWGPLLSPQANPLIVMATPAFMMIRPNPASLPDGFPGAEVPELIEWYRSLGSLPNPDRLYFRPSTTSTHWGETVGSALVNRIFTRAGLEPEILPEAATSVAALRDRNMILIGRKEYSRAVERLTRGAPFQIEFWPESAEQAVVARDANGAVKEVFKPNFGSDNYVDDAYGVITLLPSKGANSGSHRTMILSGTMSAGTHAAAEFICSEKHLEEFKALLRREGLSGIPTPLQIVVRTHVHRTTALDVTYVTHRVFASAAQ